MPVPLDNDRVTQTAWWVAPGDPQQLLAWEAARISPRYPRFGSGTVGRGIWSDTFTGPTSAGLDYSALAVTATAGSRGQTVFRVDAGTDWIPARAAGDTVLATARMAVLTETSESGSGKTQQLTVVASSTLTSPGPVSRLAGYLNGLAVNPPGAVSSCPAARPADGNLIVTSLARPGGPTLARASASLTGCGLLTYTMPGQQPAALGGGDAGNSLLTEIDRVAGLRWKTP